MPRWSLRTKLVVAAALGLLPILAIATWHGYHHRADAADQRRQGLAAAADVAVARQRELIEGSRRLLVGLCGEEAVLRSTDPAATSSDIQRCEGRLAAVVAGFPGEYSAIVVTDDQGIVRCSSSATAIGVSLVDRDIFQQVRRRAGMSVGTSIASRVTPQTIIPIAMPVHIDESFRGMCAIGISLKAFAHFVTAAGPGGASQVALVDGSGVALGGGAAATEGLPVTEHMASAISAGRESFIDYGQNGALYEYRLVPLRDEAVFVVAAAPIAQGLLPLWRDWNELALILLASIALLAAVAMGVDRWCLQPLGYLEQAMARIARGEAVKIAPLDSWGDEMVSIASRVEAMAAALASRESELKSGLEQRDHMLREIHHRVKNNLQMISSLLNLQAGEIRSPRIRRYFGDAQNRVLTLSILHRHLYERSSWSLVDFQQFISDLVRQISVGRLGIDRPAPRYQIRAPIMAVGPDTAIPVGLIVTEAVGNALNHDFSGVAAPEVHIEASEKPGHNIELVIEDNGRRTGRESIEPDSRGGFSLTLVRGLAMQLGGEAIVSSSAEGGVRLVVTFPMAAEQEADG
ncbi:MAG TPA: sensor histidine kinase [Reyranella sp.]|nr:sensor histidine kinase [Reyranella sp.]